MNKIKNMIQSTLWLCVVCFSLLVGCVHEDLSAVASVDEKIVTVNSSVNLYSYTITANSDWTFVSSDDWCVPSVTSGRGTTKVNLIITANDTAAERDATLTLTCGGKDTYITVIQGGMSTSLAVAPSFITVDSNESNGTIAVLANSSWSASCVASWVELTSVPGSGNDVIKFTAKKNDTYADRETTIIIAVSESISKSVVVKQLSQGLPSITLGAESATFTKEAGSRTISYVSNIAELSAVSEFSWCTVSEPANGEFTISVTQNSTLSSRSAVVTVSGVVDGETTSSQIVVSQSGTGSPVINLMNSAISFGSTLNTANVSWVAENNAEVVVSNVDASWITSPAASSSSVSSPMTVGVSENNNSEPRTGTIELKVTNETGEYAYYYVTVTQDGMGDSYIYSTPSVVNLSAYDKSGSIYLAKSKDVAITGVSSSNKDWLNVDLSGQVVTYTSLENTSDAMRNAIITVSYTANNVPALYTISLSQDGLGAPVISSLDNVFMQTATSAVDYDVYLVDTDITGTTLEVVSVNCDVASSTTSSANVDWLKVTKTDNSTLTLTADDNTADDARVATVTIRVIRDNAVAYKSFSVTQAGHLSAGITGLTQEIYVNHEGTTGTDANSKYGFLTLNGSEVTVMSAPSWVLSSTITEGADLNNTNDYILNIEVDEYAGGESGSFRESVIALKASNGNATDAYYEILIRQYAPEAAMIDCVSEITLSHDEYVADEIPVILFNGSEIISASVVSAEGGWLKDVVFDNATSTITYSAEKFVGPEASRNATVAVTVENSNANKYVHYIAVTQYLAEMTTITATENTSVAYGDLAAKITYSTTGSGNITVTGSTDAAWVSAIVAQNGVATITMLDNKTLVERKATIQLVAESDDNNITATTYATITQGAAPETTLEVSEKLSAIAAGETISIAYSADGYSDVKVVANESADWINGTSVSADGVDGVIELVISENVEAEPRTATVEVVAQSAATGSKVVKYVEVIQVGSGDSVMVVDPNIDINYVGVTSSVVSPTLMSGAELVSAASSAGWVKNIVVTPASFTYDIDSYDGAEGESRIATITVKAKSVAGTYSTSYVTVTQTAPKAITLSAVEAVGASFEDNSTAAVSFVTTGDATNMEVSATYSEAWISTSTPIAAATGEYTFTLAANTSSEPRSAVVLLTAYDASGDNATTATSYVTITQSGTGEAMVSTPKSIELGYEAVAATTINPIFSDNTSIARVESSASWLTVNFAADNFSYVAEAYDGAEGASRVATITVTAENGGTYATSYITVTQTAPKAITLSAVEAVGASFEDNSTAAVSFVTTGDATNMEVSATYSESWISTTTPIAAATGEYAFTLAANTSSEPRSAVVLLTAYDAAGDNATTATSYVTITQSGTGEAMVSTQKSIELGYEAVLATNVIPILSANTTIARVESSASWLTVTSAADNFSYEAEANPSKDGLSRVATITVTAENGGTYASSYITVTQLAAPVTEVTLTVPTETIQISGDKQVVAIPVRATTTQEITTQYRVNGKCATSTGVITPLSSTTNSAIVGNLEVNIPENDSNATVSHSVVVTVISQDGTQKSEVVTISQVPASETFVSLTVPTERYNVGSAAQDLTFAVRAKTTEKLSASQTFKVNMKCATSKPVTAVLTSAPGADVIVGNLTLPLRANTTSSAITHSAVVTVVSTDGTQVSKIVTVVQAAPAVEETIVTLTTPTETINVDSAAQEVSFAVQGTTTEDGGAVTISGNCATAAAAIADVAGNGAMSVKLSDNTSLTAVSHSVIVTAKSTDNTSISKVVTIVQAPATATSVTLIVPTETIQISGSEQDVLIPVRATTTEEITTSYSVIGTCGTSTGTITPIELSFNEALVGNLNVTIPANDGSATVMHTVIVTVVSQDGTQKSEVVTIAQAPATDTAVSLTVPVEPYAIDSLAQDLTFAVRATTTEELNSTQTLEVNVQCATAATPSVVINSASGANVISDNVTLSFAKNSTMTAIKHAALVTVVSPDGTQTSKVVTITQTGVNGSTGGGSDVTSTVVSLSVPTTTLTTQSTSSTYSFDVSGTTTEAGGALTFTATSTADAAKEVIVTPTGMNKASVRVNFDANLSKEELSFPIMVTATSTDGTKSSAAVTVVQNANPVGGIPVINLLPVSSGNNSLGEPATISPIKAYNKKSAIIPIASDPKFTIPESVTYTAEWDKTKDSWVTGYTYDPATKEYKFEFEELPKTLPAMSMSMMRTLSLSSVFEQELYTFSTERTAPITLVATTAEGLVEKVDGVSITQTPYYYYLDYSRGTESYTTATLELDADKTMLSVGNVSLSTSATATPTFSYEVTEYSDQDDYDGSAAWVKNVEWDGLTTNSYFTVTMDENTTTTDRTAIIKATIDVDGVEKSLQIVVTQKKYVFTVSSDDSKLIEPLSAATTAYKYSQTAVKPSINVNLDVDLDCTLSGNITAMNYDKSTGYFTFTLNENLHYEAYSSTGIATFSVTGADGVKSEIPVEFSLIQSRMGITVSPASYKKTEIAANITKHEETVSCVANVTGVTITPTISALSCTDADGNPLIVSGASLSNIADNKLTLTMPQNGTTAARNYTYNVLYNVTNTATNEFIAAKSVSFEVTQKGLTITPNNKTEEAEITADVTEYDFETVGLPDFTYDPDNISSVSDTFDANVKSIVKTYNGVDSNISTDKCTIDYGEKLGVAKIAGLSQNKTYRDIVYTITVEAKVTDEAGGEHTATGTYKLTQKPIDPKFTSAMSVYGSVKSDVTSYTFDSDPIQVEGYELVDGLSLRYRVASLNNSKLDEYINFVSVDSDGKVTISGIPTNTTTSSKKYEAKIDVYVTGMDTPDLNVGEYGSNILAYTVTQDAYSFNPNLTTPSSVAAHVTSVEVPFAPTSSLQPMPTVTSVELDTTKTNSDWVNSVTLWSNSLTFDIDSNVTSDVSRTAPVYLTFTDSNGVQTKTSVNISQDAKQSVSIDTKGSSEVEVDGWFDGDAVISTFKVNEYTGVNENNMRYAINGENVSGNEYSNWITDINVTIIKGSSSVGIFSDDISVSMSGSSNAKGDDFTVKIKDFKDITGYEGVEKVLFTVVMELESRVGTTTELGRFKILLNMPKLKD